MGPIKFPLDKVPWKSDLLLRTAPDHPWCSIHQNHRQHSLKMSEIFSAFAKTGVKILPIHHFAQILLDGILKKPYFSVRQ